MLYLYITHSDTLYKGLLSHTSQLILRFYLIQKYQGLIIHRCNSHKWNYSSQNVGLLHLRIRKTYLFTPSLVSWRSTCVLPQLLLLYLRRSLSYLHPKLFQVWISRIEGLELFLLCSFVDLTKAIWTYFNWVNPVCSNCIFAVLAHNFVVFEFHVLPLYNPYSVPI